MKIWRFASITSLQQILIVNHYFAFGYVPRHDLVNITSNHSYSRIILQAPEPFIIDLIPASCHRLCLV